MKIKIISVETRTTSRGDLKEATVTQADGNTLEKVTFWASSWPMFAEIKAGLELEADIVTKVNGKFTNVTAYAPKNTNGTAKPAYRGTQIKEAQETKIQGIKMAQENKELGIKVSSTMRMAVDCAIAEMGQIPPAGNWDIKDKIREWRSWLWQEWDKNEISEPPF